MLPNLPQKNSENKTCNGCGATAEDRKASKPDADQELFRCNNCGADKCCICDLGRDVLCANCPDEEP